MTMVKFAEEQRGVLSLLEVQAAPRRGLGRAIRGALFELRVQIVSARKLISGGRYVQALELVEFDGGRLGRARMAEIEGRLRRVTAPRRAAPRFGRVRTARAAA